MYSVGKEIIEDGSFAVCPHCGDKRKIRRLPLFIITGASCIGKSTISSKLQQEYDKVVVMESDILWNGIYNTPEDDYRQYRELWLRVCKNISQSVNPVVLCGCAIPEQFEVCAERRYFSDIHYLAVVAGDEKLKERIEVRPAYRNCDGDEFVNSQLQFNNWFKENYDKTNPNITLLNNSNQTVEQSVCEVIKWIDTKLQEE